MIKSFKHKGLEKFYRTGFLKGIQAIHANKLNMLLTLLNVATKLDDLSASFLRLHKL